VSGGIQQQLAGAATANKPPIQQTDKLIGARAANCLAFAAGLGCRNGIAGYVFHDPQNNTGTAVLQASFGGPLVGTVSPVP